MSTIEEKGLAQVLEAIAKYGKRYQKALAGALYQEASAVMQESLKEVPVDSGTLRRSHYVSRATNLEDPKAECGYGVKYAVNVHERLDLKHAAPTKSHYLVDPMVRAREGYQPRLAQRIKGLFEKDSDGGKGPDPEAPQDTSGGHEGRHK